MVRRTQTRFPRRASAAPSTPVARGEGQSSSLSHNAPSSLSSRPTREKCSCDAAHAVAAPLIHHSDCLLYQRIDLNRIKPPEVPKQEVALRRPDGLWANAVTTEDVDASVPEEHLENLSKNLERFLNIGDTYTAQYWVDVDYARKKATTSTPYVAMADYVQNLCRVRAWDRIITFIEERLLHQMHLFFAYYYITALYKLKLFAAIMNAQIGHLVELEPCDLNFENDSPIPLRTPTMPPHLVRNDIQPLAVEEKLALDDKVKELKLLSAFLCQLGKSFIAAENRTAALRFIWTAWLRDKSNMEAEELITRYNFPDGKKRQQQWDKFVARRTYFSPPSEARSLLVQAQHQFSSNNVNAAYGYTKIIMKEYGLYRPALLLHVNCAVATRDSDTLFLLAHQLVDRCPVDELSWYAVAMYYFVIGNNAAAKNFMNKTTMMNRAFGEAWVGFGHVLSAENEHEQAMNCYLKALRLLDRHQDLYVFLAMEYCRSNNIKWAMDFLKDPHLYPATSEGARPNPYREHERGCVHFTQKQFQPALNCFTRSLRAVNADTIEKSGRYVVDQIMQIDRFWEPLVANMAHTHRRLGDFRRAIILYQCSLMLFPGREQTLLGLGMCYAGLGDADRAIANLHRALSANPYNTNARQALDRLVLKSSELAASVVIGGLSSISVSADSLTQILAKEPVKVSARSSPMVLRSSTRKVVTSSVKRPNTRGRIVCDGTPSASSRYLPDFDLSPIILTPETEEMDTQ